MKRNFKELEEEFAKILQMQVYERVYANAKLPPKLGPEIVLIGKSNVGKSSLINTLLNRAIAKTSKIPGCTRWIGFIQLKNFTLIDLPGYGFASVAKGRKNAWNKMISDYINSGRPDLVLCLIDARKGIQEEDTIAAESFKCDKIYIHTKADKESYIPGEALAVSIKTGRGIAELRSLLCEISSN